MVNSERYSSLLILVKRLCRSLRRTAYDSEFLIQFLPRNPKRVVFHHKKKIRKIRHFEIRDFFHHPKKLQNEFRRNSKGFVFRFRDLVYFEMSYFSYFFPHTE